MQQQEIEIVPFDVNNASDEEWEKFHTFRKTRYSDKASSGIASQHQIPDEKFEEILKIPPSKINVLRFNVFVKNVPQIQIGEVYFSYYKQGVEDVDHKVAMVNVSVLSSHRRKGYGTLLFAKLVELANRYNKTKLLFQTTEEDGIQVVEQFNATKIMAHQQFKLKIREANWDLINNWIQKTNAFRPKITLEWINVTESIPNELIEEYTRIFASSLDEHPKWHINKRNDLTPEMVKQDIRNLVTMKGGKWELGFIREQNGNISGLTELKWNPSRPSTILQLITHIKLHYRGQGRGKLLKAGSLVHVRDQYPQVDTVKIGYVGEERMVLYEINKRLGFKQQYQQVSFEILTKELEAWIKLKS